jgi:hypothetical protein
VNLHKERPMIRRLASALVLSLALASHAAAASLTPAQLATLKADIQADSAFNSVPMSADGHATIAAAYNLPAAVDHWVWKTFVSDSEIYEVTTPAPDNTVWSWTIFIGRSQGERDAWRQMVNMAGGINPSLAQVRTGIADIFSGAGGANQRAHLLALGRRKATRGEKLFATGTGSTASPAVMSLTAEGSISGAQVEAARTLP